MGKGVLPFSLRARLSRPRVAGAADKIAAGAKQATLSISSLIVPGEKTSEGLLVTSTSAVWHEIVRLLGDDWSSASNIPPEKWEELVAGAYQKAGYDEVTLTPRSGDHGRDVIAIKKGVGSVKVIGSVKAYHHSHKVEYDS
jgi:restriction system protein